MRCDLVAKKTEVLASATSNVVLAGVMMVNVKQGEYIFSTSSFIMMENDLIIRYVKIFKVMFSFSCRHPTHLIFVVKDIFSVDKK